MTPAGRRPGPSTTAAAILAAARTLFSEAGYQATTIRAVAEAAGVNQALVRHFYGTKHQLFLAAVAFPGEPLHEMLAALQAGPRGELGRRVTTVFVRAWRDPSTSQQLQAFFRAAAVGSEGAGLARRMVEESIVSRVAALLDVPPVQVSAAVAQLVGFAFLSTILQAEPLAGLAESAVIDLLAPAVQAHLDGRGG